MRDDEIDILDMDESITMDAGHIFIDLGDNHGCFIDSGLDHIDADAETEITMVVRQRGLDQCDVDLNRSVLDEGRHLRQRNRGIIRHPLIDRFAGVGSDEKGIMTKIALEFRIRIRSYAERIDMDDLGIKKGLWMGFDVSDQCPDKVLGFTTP